MILLSLRGGSHPLRVAGPPRRSALLRRSLGLIGSDADDLIIDEHERAAFEGLGDAAEQPEQNLGLCRWPTVREAQQHTPTRLVETSWITPKSESCVMITRRSLTA